MSRVLRAAAAWTAAIDYTAAVDMTGWDFIDVMFVTTTLGTAGDFTVIAEASELTDPGATLTNWAPLLSDDDLAAGATTPATYTATLTRALGRKTLRFPERGRWIRFGITGADADGVYAVHVTPGKLKS